MNTARTPIRLKGSQDRLQKALKAVDAMHHQLIELNEKLLCAEALKTRFLALMRNEINNPLNDIMGLADRIMDPLVPTEKARHLATLVKDEAFQLDCQIRNVFCAAELEAGEAAACLARVDVESVVRDVMDSFRPSAEAKGLEVTLHLDLGNPSFLSDGEMLHHILANLVANAIQFSDPPGTVVVRVTGGVDRLFLEVADQGPGIPESNLKEIFEPFHPHGGIYKVQRGQGLGLPVVKALVDLLYGELKVETEPGQGSRFLASLPSAPAVDEMGAAATDDNILIFDEPQAF
ncbi:MAG: HAMP domain-containing sensor histidine kinase [Holophaga sp.]|nr:HAMP domain-containing sensor histidine kinase [Holophaga sp.]